MKTAYLALRASQAHRRQAMIDGLSFLGYKQVTHPDLLGPPEKSLVVTWNLHGGRIKQIETHGATVLVAENAYIQYDKEGREYVALAKSGHNGSGLTPEGTQERANRFDINLEPWKEGGHILVIGQRGIGSLTMRSPPQWGERMAAKLRDITDRKVVHRFHPGAQNVRQLPPLQEQLDGAHCVVMWASNVATTALMQGIPVFYNAPHCVLQKACGTTLDIEAPLKGQRWPAFQDLAAAQWNLEEIASGEAFQCLIDCK